MESTFSHKFKMDKLIKTVYSPYLQLKWDNLLATADFYPLKGRKNIGFTYQKNKP